MTSAAPAEIDALRRELAAARAEVATAQARVTAAEAKASHIEALVAHLKLRIEKLRRELYGARSERKARLLGQMELQLEELDAAAKAAQVRDRKRGKLARKPFPEHLPRERLVLPSPEACACCGSQRLHKRGEDVTETLEVIPRQWKVIQTVREKYGCRDCEAIAQPPAPFHVTPRGWTGPNLLAMILFEKHGQHQPLNRQAERYAREGVELSTSTLADQVGAFAFAFAFAFALRPLHDLIVSHVLSAERLHGDDTTVPVLARLKTDTGRLWV